MLDPTKPIWVNEDTYQTIQNKSSNTKLEKPKYSIMVATPVHSEVSIHYLQACLDLQKKCIKNNINVMFQLMKSSLVTQGRNLCVASFLDYKDTTHLLFIDSDIDFSFKSIMAMLESDKDVISVPYPLKTFNWEKALAAIKSGKVNTAKELSRAALMYPVRVPSENIDVNKGIIEVTHSPTGCMLIKKDVINKMIKEYPNLKIVQKTILNGEVKDKENMWNFFDTLHDPETKTYLGEDFAFCKRWRDIGGKCHAYVDEYITHVGEHQYSGRLKDEMIKVDIDKSSKDK